MYESNNIIPFPGKETRNPVPKPKPTDGRNYHPFAEAALDHVTSYLQNRRDAWMEGPMPPPRRTDHDITDRF